MLGLNDDDTDDDDSNANATATTEDNSKAPTAGPDLGDIRRKFRSDSTDT